MLPLGTAVHLMPTEADRAIRGRVVGYGMQSRADCVHPMYLIELVYGFYATPGHPYVSVLVVHPDNVRAELEA